MSGLDRWWLPLCAAADLGEQQVLSGQHFDTPLAMWRSDGVVSGTVDRCPHRGARLSLGRVEQGTIECPYHGWRFAGDGRCVRIPSAPGFAPGDSHRASAWRVREAHGLLWAAGAAAGDDEPFAPPALDTLPATRVLCGPFDVATSAPRVVENFLDTAHFGLVHEGGLGDRNHLQVPDYRVVADGFGRPGVPHYRAWQPQASSAARGGAWVDYAYQLLSPLSALLQKHSDGTMPGEAYALWTCPSGHESCRVWFTIFSADAQADAHTLREFQQRIFAQDRPVLESQRPRQLPLSGGEAFCAADRFSAAYRRWLLALGFDYGCC